MDCSGAVKFLEHDGKIHSATGLWIVPLVLELLLRTVVSVPRYSFINAKLCGSCSEGSHISVPV